MTKIIFKRRKQCLAFSLIKLNKNNYEDMSVFGLHFYFFLPHILAIRKTFKGQHEPGTKHEWQIEVKIHSRRVNILSLQYNQMDCSMQHRNLDEKDNISGKSQWEASNCVSQANETPLYFHSILCIPDLLDNPSNTEHSFMNNLFKDREIKKVRRNKDFLSVDVVQKKSTAPSKKVLSESSVVQSFEFKNSQLKNELKASYQSLSDFFGNKQDSEPFSASLPGEDEYYEWFHSVKHKAIIGWYVPFSENGPKLKSFSISSSLLKMLGYQIDELALDIQHLGAQALDLVDGQAYKATFLMLVNSIRKFRELKLIGGITKEQILKQGETTLINEMKGKVNKKITVETKISMMSENIICYEILRLLDQRQVRDNLRKLSRDDAIYKLEQNAFNSLSKIAKLPKIIDPSNSAKICSYVEIRSLRQGSKNEKKQSQEQKVQKLSTFQVPEKE